MILSANEHRTMGEHDQREQNMYGGTGKSRRDGSYCEEARVKEGQAQSDYEVYGAMRCDSSVYMCISSTIRTHVVRVLHNDRA